MKGRWCRVKGSVGIEGNEGELREIGKDDDPGPKIGPGAIRGRWRVDLGSILMVPRVQELTNVRWMMVTTLGAQLGRIGRRGERYKVDFVPQRWRERCGGSANALKAVLLESLLPGTYTTLNGC